LLGTANEPKQERLALRATPFLHPHVHEVILSPPSRSKVNLNARADKPVLQIG
jgi:hypothetical protein